MVPSAQYPRSRYVVMQGTLLVVLLGTIALAHWVTVRHEVSLSDGQEITLGSYTLRMPAGWEISRSQNDQVIQVTAAEPEHGGRRLTVIYQVVDEPVTPMDYLLHSGLVGGSWHGAQMTLDGNPGVYVQMMRILESGRSRVLIKDLLACVVLPSRQVLTMQLSGQGRVDESDQQLMHRFLTDVQIKPEPKAPSQPSSDQWENI
ncbi:MAG TPA: hypothetical protein VG722_03265 [Tepidisphaeraceae bacterium]|nr:hypothetical protein [Tepidisphaeraceae bacterium]